MRTNVTTSILAVGHSSLVASALLAGGISVFTTTAEAQCGADIYGANRDVGGGFEYTDQVSRNSADFLVDTRSELVGALASASPGDIVYIENDAEIDLVPPGLPGDQWQITIPEGVTLASGRGQIVQGTESPGGLLYVDPEDLEDCPRVDEDGDPSNYCYGIAGFLLINSPGVRITGLRIDGSDYAVGDSQYGPPITDAIVARDSGSLEVDNCELFGFSHGAVYAKGTVVDVHHNHIHHNRRTGLGYGVVLSLDADVLIESNILHHNRHDIAATGDPRQDYTARYNLVIGQGTSHAFDVHGEKERNQPVGTHASGYAGGTITIEHNTFVDDARPAVKFRGAPFDFGYVDSNVFPHSAAAHDAIQQHMWGTVPREPGLLGAYDESNPGEMPAATTNGFQRARQSGNCAGRKAWYRYDPWYEGFYPLATSDFTLSSLAFGDFDGDDRADVFRTSGTKWYVSSGATSHWTELATQSYTLGSLAFGNFVGDGRTDVFRASGSRWYAYDVGAGAWVSLATSAFQLDQLAFGDFVGDSRTDVFRASGSRWYASDAGQSAWVPLATSRYRISDLAFGDFVGDSRTDVFWASGSAWYVSDAGQSRWQQIATSSFVLSDLAFADVIGDERTDVLRSSGHRWYVSDGGSSAWEVYADFYNGSYPISSLGFADFDGDGKDDAFFAGTP